MGGTMGGELFYEKREGDFTITAWVEADPDPMDLFCDEVDDADARAADAMVHAMGMQTARDDLYARQERGDLWAWGAVHVECKHDPSGICGRDSLHGCSYADAKDFMQADGYFPEMLDSARENCMDAIRKMKLALAEVVL